MMYTHSHIYIYGPRERVGVKERLESSPNHMIYGLEKEKGNKKRKRKRKGRD